MTTIGKYKYVEIQADTVPWGVRFDVPRRNSGQMVEYAFGGHERGEHDEGDLYMRRTDATDPRRGATYYRRAS